MTLDELLESAPQALDELTAELFRCTDLAMRKEAESQLTACLQLGLRAASLLTGMSAVLQPQTMDSFETLCRAYVESRDLLMTFRFDDKGAHEKLAYWFAGKKDNAWKADHTKVDEFVTRLGAQGLQLASNWSKLSVLSHPTKYAADNSTVVVVARMTGLMQAGIFELKKADFAVSVSRLVMAVTFDLPGWIALGLDTSRMPHVEPYSLHAETMAAPILDATPEHPLPEHITRQPKTR